MFSPYPQTACDRLCNNSRNVVVRQIVAARANLGSASICRSRKANVYFYTVKDPEAFDRSQSCVLFYVP